LLRRPRTARRPNSSRPLERTSPVPPALARQGCRPDTWRRSGPAAHAKIATRGRTPRWQRSKTQAERMPCRVRIDPEAAGVLGPGRARR
jgi:hypothetical protein